MNCRDCGEPIQFLEGDRRPYDLTPRVHYANKIHQAAMQEKNGAPARRRPSKSGDSPATEAYELAVAGLMVLKFKVTEAKELLKDIPEGEPTDMVLAALKKKGEATIE